VTDETTIVVCGATGNQGGAVVESLLAGGARGRVAAISRSPGGGAARALAARGVELRRGDLMDAESLVEAFRGARAVFGVTQPWSADYRTCDVRGEVEQGRNLVDACAAAGVAHLVLSTVLVEGPGPSGIPHVDSKIEVEIRARARGIPLTILRPGSFMDNIGMPFYPVKRNSVRGFVAPDAKMPYIACRDIGVMAARSFERPDEFIGREVNAVGDFISGKEIAAIFARILGVPGFRYTAVPAIAVRLFAREFWAMRRAFEKNGRPPYPSIIDEWLAETRRVCGEGNVTTMERFLEGRFGTGTTRGRHG